jgi:predicted RNA binding protein YcfA (HicA-like mRNA interferase family)
MATGYAPRIKEILREHGCEFVRHGKGDHDIWQSPISNARFVVDGKILSRHLANAVLRQAGIKMKVD